MFRSLYTGLYYFLLPFICLRVLWRSLKAPAYRRRVKERFAYFDSPRFAQARHQAPIMIHTVSVGETIAALPLIKRLLCRYKNTPLVITTMTPTGSKRVTESLHQEIQDKQVFHVYLPYDLPLLLHGFLKKIGPKLVLIMETELWPNVLHVCKKRDIPTVLINGRLSEKSAGSYRRVKYLTQAMLNDLSFAIIQSHTDAQRFLSLGLAQEKILVGGNLKFDIEITASMRKQARMYRSQWQTGTQRPILLAASTHEGEEVIVLKAFAKVLEHYVDKQAAPLLLLVPRHPERFSEVIALAQKSFNTTRLSQQNITPAMQVLVGDVMGKLGVFYGAIDVAFVGGSLFSRGGHNVLEAAVWQVPIISGRSMFNFQAVADSFAKNDALNYVSNAQELADAFLLFLQNKAAAGQSALAAYETFQQNGGALYKTLDKIDELML